MVILAEHGENMERQQTVNRANPSYTYGTVYVAVPQTGTTIKSPIAK